MVSDVVRYCSATVLLLFCYWSATALLEGGCVLLGVWRGWYILTMSIGHFLDEVKSMALHRSVWFRALDQLERGIVGMAARVVDRVEGAVLCVELVKILRKLGWALRGGVVRWMEEHEFEKANEIAEQAMEWGYEAAWSWALDFGFVRFMTMMDLGKPTGFGVC